MRKDQPDRPRTIIERVIFEGMKKEDARSIPVTAQEEKRKQAVYLRKKKYTYKAIAEIVGVHERTVMRWIHLYQDKGAKAIKARRQGRPSGSGRIMTTEQEKRIQKLIIRKTPDQLKISYALWTSEAVKKLIQQEYNIKIASRTVGKYLHLWGFIAQKPLKKAYQQKPKQIQQWLDETYPAIKARARAEKAEIYWGDEAGIFNEKQRRRGGNTPKGKASAIRLNAKHSVANILAATNNQGKLCFRIFKGAMDADILIDFMKRLIKTANKKVFLILDNLRLHHARAVKVWLEKNDKIIEVIFLPTSLPVSLTRIWNFRTSK